MTSPSTVIDYAGADPDSYRMTVGEHLEELRRRLIFALLGFGIVLIACFFFGREVMSYFCKPLMEVLLDNEISPQVYFTDLSEPFMVYMKICLISAASIASPWIVLQVWLFVAAGLYPHERKTVTRYVPLSIALLISGMLFVYFLVLPWTIQFFMAFSISIPLPSNVSAQVAPPAAPTTAVAAESNVAPTYVQSLPGDPADATDNRIWYDSTQHRLKMKTDGKVRVLQFGPENLTAPLITLSDYIELVLGMLLTFGLSFQMPLVVLAAVATGIVSIKQLRSMRRIVYLVMAVIASVITPGDVITATIALMFPLIGLYELGIFLARRKQPVEKAATAD